MLICAGLLGLRSRINMQQLRNKLGLDLSNVSFAAQMYIYSVLFMAHQLQHRCKEPEVRFTN